MTLEYNDREADGTRSYLPPCECGHLRESHARAQSPFYPGCLWCACGHYNMAWAPYALYQTPGSHRYLYSDDWWSPWPADLGVSG